MKRYVTLLLAAVVAAAAAPAAGQAAPAGKRPAGRPATDTDNRGKEQTKRADADLSRLLPMRVGLKWYYDGMTVAKWKRRTFRWTVQCLQVARTDGVRVGLFIHDYHKIKQAPSIPPGRRQQPTGPGRFALVLLPAQAWFIRLPDVKPSAEPTIAEKDLLAIADKLRKSVAEDKIPEGLTIMGLLSLDKPRPAGPDYPAQSVGASGAFFSGYFPWEAVPFDDPHLKHMKLKLKGKLSAWIKHVGDASFPAWAILQPGVGLIRLSWFTPRRIRDAGYWIQFNRLEQPGERAKLLKQHVGTFRLTLRHLNPQGPNIRPVVRLTVAAVGTRVPTWKISKAQALKLIDHLAAEGFLASSRNIFDTKADEIAGPCCVLSVGGPPRVSLEENLGWDLKMLKRLDVLRKVLDKGSDAGKAMDKLLAALEPQRKKWEKDAGPAVRGVLYYQWSGFSIGAGFRRTCVSAFEVDFERRRARRLNAAARRPQAMLSYKEQNIFKLLVQQAWVPLTEQQAANLRRLTEKWLATDPPKAYLIPRGSLGREDGRTAKLVALLKDGRRETEFRLGWAKKQSPPPPEAKALMAQAWALTGGAGIKGPATAPASQPARPISILYDAGWLTRTTLRDGVLTYVYHTVKPGRQRAKNMANYDRHEFSKRLSDAEIARFNKWIDAHRVFSLPPKFEKEDSAKYAATASGRLSVRRGRQRYETRLDGRGEIPEKFRKAVLALEALCEDIRKRPQPKAPPKGKAS